MDFYRVPKKIHRHVLKAVNLDDNMDVDEIVHECKYTLRNTNPVEDIEKLIGYSLKVLQKQNLIKKEYDIYRPIDSIYDRNFIVESKKSLILSRKRKALEPVFPSENLKKRFRGGEEEQNSNFTYDYKGYTTVFLTHDDKVFKPFPQADIAIQMSGVNNERVILSEGGLNDTRNRSYEVASQIYQQNQSRMNLDKRVTDKQLKDAQQDKDVKLERNVQQKVNGQRVNGKVVNKKVEANSVGAMQVAVRQEQVKQVGVRQLGVKQVKVKQVGDKQVEVKQVGVKQVGVKQVGIKQVGVRQVLVKQDRTKQDRTKQARTKQTRTKQDRVKQDRTEQDRTKQDRVKQPGIVEAGIEQVGVERAGVAQVGVAQVRVEQVSVEQVGVGLLGGGQTDVEQAAVEQGGVGQGNDEQVGNSPADHQEEGDNSWTMYIARMPIRMICAIKTTLWD